MSDDQDFPAEDPLALDDDRGGSWVILTEDNNYYLDLDNRFMIQLLKDEQEGDEEVPGKRTRLQFDDEIMVVPHILACRVGEPLVVEIMVGEPLRPRTAINSRVVSIVRMSS